VTVHGRVTDAEALEDVEALDAALDTPENGTLDGGAGKVAPPQAGRKTGQGGAGKVAGGGPENRPALIRKIEVDDRPSVIPPQPPGQTGGSGGGVGKGKGPRIDLGSTRPALHATGGSLTMTPVPTPPPPPYTAPPLPVTADPDAEAVEIYNAYPRKEDRKDAIKAINRAIQRLKKHGCAFSDGKPIANAGAMLLGRTKDYAEHRRKVVALNPEKASFTPYPATWFNKSRYELDPFDTDLESKSNAQHTPHPGERASEPAANYFKPTPLTAPRVPAVPVTKPGAPAHADNPATAPAAPANPNGGGAGAGGPGGNRPEQAPGRAVEQPPAGGTGPAIIGRIGSGGHKPTFPASADLRPMGGSGPSGNPPGRAGGGS
jgi:hypothetical protein